MKNFVLYSLKKENRKNVVYAVLMDGNRVMIRDFPVVSVKTDKEEKEYIIRVISDATDYLVDFPFGTYYVIFVGTVSLEDNMWEIRKEPCDYE